MIILWSKNFFKIQPNTQSIELWLRNKWYTFVEDWTSLVEVPYSQSFSWRTFSIFWVLPIISAVRLEMAKRSRIPTVLNGHKAIGPRIFWDVEQSDWRNGNYSLANPIWSYAFVTTYTYVWVPLHIQIYARMLATQMESEPGTICNYCGA